MATLVCEICGGKLVIQSGGVAKCDSCGMEYTKERIQEKIQEIKGTVKIEGSVETVIGDAEKERLLKNAETYLKLNNPVSAVTELSKYIKLFPDDIKPRIMSFNISISSSNIRIPSDLFGIDGLYETILTLDGNKEYVSEVEKKIESYVSDIMTGKKQFKLDYASEYYRRYYKWEQSMKNPHLKKIVTIGIENAKKINTLVYNGFERIDPASEEALAHSPNTPCYFAFLGQISTPFGRDYSLPCERIFKKGNLDQQIKDMYENRMRKHRCRYCGGEFYGVFNKKCSRCFRPKDY